MARTARRRFCPAPTLLAGLLACSAGPPPDARPNFLVVISDDLRFDALGVVQREQGAAARFPWLATPNLDRLAADGVRLRNAFAVSALCSPSRAALLTGLYGHRNGVTSNEGHLDPAAVTYAGLLRAAGYATGYVGKWHMDEQLERPGFEWSASYRGQGRYFDCSFWVDGRPQPTHGWIDDVATDYALDFLRRHDAAPFLLVVGYKAPHGPREPESVPERARGRHRAVELRPPPSAEANAPFPRAGVRKASPGTGPGVRLYFDLVSALDDDVGRLLDELDALGIADRTVVVFLGDNGLMLGEHGISAKRAAYESSIRIPMLVRWPALGPGARGRTLDPPILNVDLAPTLLELAGIPAPRGLHGQSFRALLAGEPAPWRRAFLYEYYQEQGFATPTHFALRDVGAKLIVYPGHPEWTELYDLAADPREMRNLAGDPERRGQLETLRAQLDGEARALSLDPAALEP